MAGTTEDFDAIVIGGGSGGLSFARHAAQHGKRVCLIERDKLGGTCVHRGCVPKKLWWTVARAQHETEMLLASGVLDRRPGVDLARLAELRGQKIDDIVSSYRDTLDEAGVDYRRGEARLDGDGVVVLDGTARLRAPHIVLATGGRPSMPDIPGKALCATSDDALDWTDLPARLVVVGGGYIGCEFAAVQAALGAEVTIISDTETVLTEFSTKAAELGMENLKRQGIAMILSTKPTEVRKDDDGSLRVLLDDGQEIPADKVLMATGRDTNLEALGDLADAVRLNDGGRIETDGQGNTSRDGLHAIGDCGDRLPLTPVAVDDGRVLAARLFGAGGSFCPTDRVATTAYVLPPVAEVGDTDDIDNGSTQDPLENATRANGPGARWSYAQTDGRLTGISLVGSGVEEGIGFAAQLIAARRPLPAFAEALPVHPTLTEGMLTAPYDDT